MALLYDYALAIWLRLELEGEPPILAAQLREYLEAEYHIRELEVTEAESVDRTVGEVTVSLQLQLTFSSSQMDDDEPSDETLGDLDRELRAYFEARYTVNCMELMDDALTSYLLAEWEDETPTDN